jgi:hypothetical protein
MEQALSDPRRRRLTFLAAVSVVLVVLAVLALWRQSEQLAPRYHPAPMFPDLPHQAQTVSRIHIAAKNGSFDVVQKPGKGWVIATRNDIPASFEQVNHTVIGLATLETLEPKTARADWLHYLNLDAPPKGSGVLVELYDNRGQKLAAVITGKSEEVGGPSGASSLFVRKPDSDQTWLARGNLEPKGDVADWYDKALVNLDRSRIAETSVTPPDGPGLTVRREKPSAPDFRLVNMPAGREPADPGTANGLGSALTDLSFDDAKPASSFDFSKATRFVSRTFDGLVIVVRTVKKGQAYWATVFAQAPPGKPALAKQAGAINGKTAGWAYKLPPEKGQQVTASLESVLKPLHPPKEAKSDSNTDNDSEE